MSYKITCNVTGKEFTFVNGYFDKQIEEIGSEDKFRRIYACRDARKYLKKGYDIQTIQRILNITDIDINVDHEKEIVDYYNTSQIKRMPINIDVDSFTHNQTDPEVKQFLEKIL